MRVAVNSHALPVYKKYSIASLICIFETTTLFCLCELLLAKYLIEADDIGRKAVADFID